MGKRYQVLVLLLLFLFISTISYGLICYFIAIREHSIALQNYAIFTKNGAINTGNEYNSETDVFFTIDDYGLNKPVYLKTANNAYLSYDEEKNVVSLKTIEDGGDPSPKEQWILESEDGYHYYIKYVAETAHKNQYLGSPNKNRKGFLYTTKNRFTKWRILHVENNVYEVRYKGSDFDRDELTIVIARYKEDVKWAKPYNDLVVLYNKGPDDDSDQAVTPLEFDTIVKLKNEGREGDTYLHHIIENYGNLSKRTMFMQGEPFEHNSTLLFGIDNYDKHDQVQAMTNRYNDRIPPPEFVNKHKKLTDYGFEYLVFKVDGNMKCKEFYDWGMDNVIDLYRGSFKENAGLTLMEGFLKDAKFPYTSKPGFFAEENVSIFLSAVFSTTREKIMKNDVDCYKRLRDTLLRNSVCGYILERLWLFILDKNVR